MRALLQRVLEAKVVVDGETTGEIQHGILVFLGLGKEDTLDKGKKLIDKILKYRFFDDEQGKMGWNVAQANGGLLLVSQFTLAADTEKGMRASFTPAASPEEGRRWFDYVVERARARHAVVATGRFGAHMQVHLVNDGPVTLLLDTITSRPPR